MAAKEYIHFIDDLGVHLTKREFDNGAKIWDAAIRSAEALKPSHNSVRAVICGACGSADVDEVYHCQTCDTKSVVSTVGDRKQHP